MAFFSVPDLVEAITPRPGFCSAAREPPLALVVFTTSWRLAGMRLQQAGQFRAGEIRADQIELVLHAVEGAVADQQKQEIVLRLGLAGDLSHHFGDA